MAVRKESEYIFANAYVGSHAKYLMSQEDLMRVATSKDLESAEVILRDYGYGEAKELKDGSIEHFVRREKNKLFRLVYSSLPDPDELVFNRYPYDYHNVKVCLKSEILGIIPDENYLMSSGSIPQAKIVSIVKNRNYELMSSHMKNGVIAAMDQYSRGNDPQVIDLVLDKACYADILESVEKLGNAFLLDLIKLKIDTLNISTFIRLRNLGKQWNVFKDIYIPGGRISLSMIISFYDEPYARIGEKLESYGLQDVVTQGGKSIEEDNDFLVFEKMIDNILMEYVKKARYIPWGIEPIEGYWYAKECEIDNLRIALMGNYLNTEPEEIRERLRNTYV